MGPGKENMSLQMELRVFRGDLDGFRVDPKPNDV